MKKLLYVSIFTMIASVAAAAQLTLPIESQRAEVSQIVGDTKIAVVYNRPNTKGRTNIFGCTATEVVPKGNGQDPCLVPYGQVWRTGANENTTIEFANPVKVNGADLPAGKYGLHMIPGKDEWTVIFNKVNNEWGSFRYDVKQDQLRVMAKPQTAEFAETMSLGFENVKPAATDVVVRWEKVRVPFTVEAAGMNDRVLNYIREKMKIVDAKDFRSQVQGANWVLQNKMTANYAEAISWLDAQIAREPRYGALALKATLQGELGKTADAIATAEQALALAKTAKPAPNTAALEKSLAEWKAKK